MCILIKDYIKSNLELKIPILRLKYFLLKIQEFYYRLGLDVGACPHAPTVSSNLSPQVTGAYSVLYVGACAAPVWFRLFDTIWKGIWRHAPTLEYRTSPEMIFIVFLLYSVGAWLLHRCCMWAHVTMHVYATCKITFYKGSMSLLACAHAPTFGPSDHRSLDL